MKTVRLSGFTLIELLTVIAIIAILAGLTSVALPRALERAKIADMQGDFQAISTAMVHYYGDHDTFPPRYGFRTFQTRGKVTPFDFTNAPSRDTPPRENDFVFEPYMFRLGLWSFDGPALALHDRFSTNYDTDRNLVIDRMEFSPVVPAEFDRSTLTTIYTGGVSVADLGAPWAGFSTGKFRGEERPYVYAPVNLSIFRRVKQIWDNNDPFATRWVTVYDPSFNIRFPEPRYDAYVLLSVGRGVEFPERRGARELLPRAGVPDVLPRHARLEQQQSGGLRIPIAQRRDRRRRLSPCILECGHTSKWHQRLRSVRVQVRQLIRTIELIPRALE
jgi:prepilin-type N-terminal cleavage/methylation domain-containing protein